MNTLDSNEQQKIDALIPDLKSKQREYITKGMANSDYILSRMAPLLEKRAVDKFADLAWQQITKLASIQTQTEFDQFHDHFVEDLISNIKDKNGDQVCYGHAQKPINVFLKGYVFVTRFPDENTAAKLSPFLHVPLDSYMMKYFFKEFPISYCDTVHSIVNNICGWIKAQHGIGLSDRDFLEMGKILTKGHYYAWQGLFRLVYPDEPVFLDTIYSILRTKDDI